jgi:hypothetical protein
MKVSHPEHAGDDLGRLRVCDCVGRRWATNMAAPALYRMDAMMSVRSAQPPETVPRKTTDDVVQGVGKIVNYAVDEPSFQFTRLSVAQLDAHEEQHAFDEHGLASRSNMPDCFLGVTQSPRVVRGRVAGRLHGPEINPRRPALVAERHGAEGRKSPGVVDDERGIGGGHGDDARYPGQPNFRLLRSIRRPAGCEEGMYAGFDAAHNRGWRRNSRFSTGFDPQGLNEIVEVDPPCSLRSQASFRFREHPGEPSMSALVSLQSNLQSKRPELPERYRASTLDRQRACGHGVESASDPGSVCADQTCRAEKAGICCNDQRNTINFVA